jgi:hypothetical protein
MSSLLNAIAAGRNPAAISNDGGAVPCSGRHYSTILLRTFLRDGFPGWELC